MLPEGDPGIAGITYRVCLDCAEAAPASCAQDAHADAVWTIQGGGSGAVAEVVAAVRLGTSRPDPASRRQVKVEGNTISLQGTLPAGFKAGDQVFVSADVHTPGSSAGDRRPGACRRPVTIRGLEQSGSGFLVREKAQDGPFPVSLQSFHYLKPPRAVDLTCTVIKALGDKFDFLAYYSDFRIDNPEAGTSSTGPLGGGPTAAR